MDQLHSLPPPLQRTSSAMSFSSEDDNASLSSSTVILNPATRRTRKRFTNVQLTMLEQLFHQNSHPSREDRESVAKAGGMEIKSVTIWFQNKRQTERKSLQAQQAQQQQTQAQGMGNGGGPIPHMSSTMHTFSLHPRSGSGATTSPNAFGSRSNSLSSVTSSTSSNPGAVAGTRPTLDRVASRSELRINHTTPNSAQHQAATPRKSAATHPSGHIWETMPSSPIGPPTSPPQNQREIVEYGKRRTLEWACAAARLNDRTKDEPDISTSKHRHLPHHRERERRHSHSASSKSRPNTTASKEHSRQRKDSFPLPSTRRSIPSSSLVRTHSSLSNYSSPPPTSSPKMDVDSTDLEDNDDDDEEGDPDHEAITPPSTWGKGDTRWEGQIQVVGAGHIGGIRSLATAAAEMEDQENKEREREKKEPNATPSQQGQGQGRDDDDMIKAALALCGLGRRS